MMDMESESVFNPIRCPVCGQAMIEMDKTIVNGFWYIWHHCSQDCCDGQRLVRRRVPEKTSSVEVTSGAVSAGRRYG